VTNGLNYVDLVFVVDTTGSMGPFIDDAKRRLVDCVQELGGAKGIDLRVGLVEYRDHPPQEASFVTRGYELTDNLGKVRKAIAGLAAHGGGDAPEAVFDGVLEACRTTSWRATSCRFVVLVGDAPPHGYFATAGRGRGARELPAAVQCTCGLDLLTVTAAAEEQRAVVHALPFGGNTTAQAAFTDIASATGGACTPVGQGRDVVERIRLVLDEEFANLDFDARVLDTVRSIGSLDTGLVTEALAGSRLTVARSIARLGRRGFLEGL
jgi:hypothetical protein